ncbi:MAG: hypothetical protein KJ893_01615 [Candidatus Omnitrophica bacterium]|nr:hypothetical protein [Candidatus Omnitrophota bacterium]MBU4479058.1 hypothetical protein [Candidatus Omnitrophota bacterium]MCG2702765.1 hypothetical protein [Candidatus Omnitrophota bacterium]
MYYLVVILYIVIGGACAFIPLYAQLKARRLIRTSCFGKIISDRYEATKAAQKLLAYLHHIKNDSIAVLFLDAKNCCTFTKVAFGRTAGLILSAEEVARWANIQKSRKIMFVKNHKESGAGFSSADIYYAASLHTKLQRNSVDLAGAFVWSKQGMKSLLEMYSFQELIK